MEVITSSKNQMVKEIISLTTKKSREKLGFFMVEGVRSVDEIPADWLVDKLIICKELLSKSINLDDYLHNFINLHENTKIYYVNESVMNKITNTTNSSGIIAICKTALFSTDDIVNKINPFIIIGENISDPGNLGSLIRIADASSASGVILSTSCVDLYNPKVIRATMGSIFHLPIVDNVDISSLFEVLKNHNIKTYGAYLNTDNYIYSANLNEPCAIIIGNEAHGLSDFAIKKCDVLFKIPMLGQAESLNAAVACGILAFEVVRQRIKL